MNQSYLPVSSLRASAKHRHARHAWHARYARYESSWWSPRVGILAVAVSGSVAGGRLLPRSQTALARRNDRLAMSFQTERRASRDVRRQGVNTECIHLELLCDP